MIDQIEQKVVNRLRQVTSAIMQAGKNQVDVITSKAEKEAAVEFAKASAMRPEVVGRALAEMSSEKDVLEALFESLEVERIVKSDAKLTLVPKDSSGGKLMAQLIAAEEDVRGKGGSGLRPPTIPGAS